MASHQWKQQTLEAHNKLRAKHGAPPLTWNEECYEFAKKQADACQSSNNLHHGNQGPSGSHGQNAFWSIPPRTAMEAVNDWYNEVNDPGYDFSNPGFGGGTGHFTQVVWKETKSVGMAKSDNGCYIIANYFPAGNMIMNGDERGCFEKNVLEEGSTLKCCVGPIWNNGEAASKVHK